MTTRAGIILTVAAGLLLSGGAYGQGAKQDTAAEAARQQMQAADVLEARMIIDDLGEQMRIAQAKLEPESLERKRKIGRTQTLLKAADGALQALAARTQRLVEHSSPGAELAEPVPHATCTSTACWSRLRHNREKCAPSRIPGQGPTPCDLPE